MRGGDFGGHMGGGMGFGGVLCALLLLAALGCLVFMLIKRAKLGKGACPMCAMRGHDQSLHSAGADAAQGAPEPVDALRKLDARLAHGDIDVKDYMARKAALLGDRDIQDPPKGD